MRQLGITPPLERRGASYLAGHFFGSRLLTREENPEGLEKT